MPYSRVVFRKIDGNFTYIHISHLLSNLFEEVWREFKTQEVKNKDYWMEVADPQARLGNFAGQVITKAKLRTSETLSHAVGNNRAWFYVGSGKLVPVGELLYADNAFERILALPGMGAQAVVNRRDNDKEYVFDAYDQLTPRYVYRFITSTDEANLKTRNGLKPRNEEAGDNVYMHVAGKGNTRFISTTRSKKPIQNPHGETFGVKRVKIDLSLISRQHIYDVSTPQGEVELLKGKSGTSGVPESYTSQVQQALKDAKRTKEVLVENSIPQDAIVETAGFTLNGVPCNDAQNQ
jgi:hypothetical protein